MSSLKYRPQGLASSIPTTLIFAPYKRLRAICCPGVFLTINFLPQYSSDRERTAHPSWVGSLTTGDSSSFHSSF